MLEFILQTVKQRLVLNTFFTQHHAYCVKRGLPYLVDSIIHVLTARSVSLMNSYITMCSSWYCVCWSFPSLCCFIKMLAHCFPFISHSCRKKQNTLSHVYCYPIWKYFYYCDIKYFHFVLRMQTKTHFTIVISFKKGEILKEELNQTVEQLQLKFTIIIHSFTHWLTQAWLTSRRAK